MLVLVRERVLAVDSNKLYLPTAVFEDIGEQGQCELHKHKLWPEHTSLKFTFAHSQNSDVQYFVTPYDQRCRRGVRRGCPSPRHARRTSRRSRYRY